MTQTLGGMLQTLNVAIEGRPTVAESARLAYLVMKWLDVQSYQMKPAIYEYPIQEAGGTGHTLVQPFATSYLKVIYPGSVAADTYDGHGYFFLCINVCVPFLARKILRRLYINGFKIIAHTETILKPRKKSWWERFWT